MTTGQRTVATAPAAAATSGAPIASVNGWVSSRSGDKLSIYYPLRPTSLALFFFPLGLPILASRMLLLSSSLFLSPFHRSLEETVLRRYLPSNTLGRSFRIISPSRVRYLSRGHTDDVVFDACDLHPDDLRQRPRRDNTLR